MAHFAFTQDETGGAVRNWAGYEYGIGASRGDASVIEESPFPRFGPEKSLRLDGSGDHVSTEVVVPTDKSFTVAAWARLDAVDRTSSVLSQDGMRVSGFSLKAQKNGAWEFGIPQADAENVAWDVVRGPTVAANRWTHLAGVYDAAVNELRFYVNGSLVGKTKRTSTWKASGGLQIGRGMWNGIEGDHLAGGIDEVHAWTGARDEAGLADYVVPAAQSREDRCNIGHWLHAGGPQVKAAASAALAGTDYDRRLTYQQIGGTQHQLTYASFKDQEDYRVALPIRGLEGSPRKAGGLGSRLRLVPPGP
ncbi:LamG domain-containing protein [Actinoplanes sp. NPDC051859]|uniref:LamG domain-containing protein n=1 Tax=Actinoplanes sp. NPDC051859 TaxID=3363909 RepID=UPI00378E1C8E